MKQQTRTESDLLGTIDVPADALWGIHTARAKENFPFRTRPVPPGMIGAYGTVKRACLTTCDQLGVWGTDQPKTEAIVRACTEMSEGQLNEHIVVDLMQGGAGTSLNMNVNEVLANRALQILNKPLGSYTIVSPTDDINRYQSTNDTYPTALKLAAIVSIQKLEQNLIALQEAFQQKEKQFAHIVKVARTQFQDAVLTTLGRQMGAYAEAINRDRWRIYKCVERLRVVNLGGTAIGTGLVADRQYIFRVVDTLREMTGIGFARAENLYECTQNADVFVEVSGILKANAVSLIKIGNDLRFLSSGPDAGIGEIRLPARQAGSSIMPGKVNPVICESIIQAAMQVMGNDTVITQACAAGNLELNAFLPLVTANLLYSIDLLTTACDIFGRYCIAGLEANEEKCRQYVENSTVTATALVTELGYEKASQIAKQAKERNKTIRQIVTEQKLLSNEQFDELISPEAVCRLGFRKP
ncbi:MAG: aspartate ammonia-lyase [Planctomycetes bacterium]|nr:aspartate ammonia-lyase [Planctomycetota bacterium]